MIDTVSKLCYNKGANSVCNACCQRFYIADYANSLYGKSFPAPTGGGFFLLYKDIFQIDFNIWQHERFYSSFAVYLISFIREVKDGDTFFFWSHNPIFLNA